MNIFGYYIEKRIIMRILIVILLIVIGIISVNIRLSKNKIKAPMYQGYTPDKGSSDVTEGGAISTSANIALYDYDKVMKYFVKFEDSIAFKDYIINYMLECGTVEGEWWVKNINYNDQNKELSFYLFSNTQESFYIVKNNDDTYINYTRRKK